MTNLDIWDALATTDKSQTKDFTRGGGFRGTATRPMYLIKKMTETFGPCGFGWGYDAPTFQTVPGANGELAVYCTVKLWVKRPGETEVSAPMFGIGGDFVVKQMKERLTTDDEAFKKAFTDALGNAMKHLGMSADIHMGEFDGSKYHAAAEKPASARNGSAAPSISQRAETARRAPQGAAKGIPPDPNHMTGDPASVRKRMVDAVNKSNAAELTKLTHQASWLDNLERLPEDDKVAIDNAVADRQAVLSDMTMAG